MITTLLFDYAGVLTPTSNNLPFVNQFHKDYNLKPKELMKITYTDWDKAAVGKMDSKLFWEQIAKILKTDAQVLRRRVIDTFPIDDRVIKLLDELKSQYTMVLISNQIHDWLEEVIAENNLRDIFNFTANSYEVGKRKPDPEIFQYALKVSSSKPHEAVFIDDSPKNIEAAKKLGMHTILFSDFQNFKQELNTILETA